MIRAMAGKMVLIYHINYHKNKTTRGKFTMGCGKTGLQINFGSITTALLYAVSCCAIDDVIISRNKPTGDAPPIGKLN